MSVSAIVWVWVLVGLAFALLLVYTDGRFSVEEAVGTMLFGVAFAPVGVMYLPILVPEAVKRFSRDRANKRLARAHALEADYQETLRLIEWTPRPRTALDELADELEIESGGLTEWRP